MAKPGLPVLRGPRLLEGPFSSLDTADHDGLGHAEQGQARRRTQERSQGSGALDTRVTSRATTTFWTHRQRVSAGGETESVYRCSRNGVGRELKSSVVTVCSRGRVLPSDSPTMRWTLT